MDSRVAWTVGLVAAALLVPAGLTAWVLADAPDHEPGVAVFDATLLERVEPERPRPGSTFWAVRVDEAVRGPSPEPGQRVELEVPHWVDGAGDVSGAGETLRLAAHAGELHDPPTQVVYWRGYVLVDAREGLLWGAQEDAVGVLSLTAGLTAASAAVLGWWVAPGGRRWLLLPVAGGVLVALVLAGPAAGLATSVDESPFLWELYGEDDYVPTAAGWTFLMLGAGLALSSPWVLPRGHAAAACLCTALVVGPQWALLAPGRAWHDNDLLGTDATRFAAEAAWMLVPLAAAAWVAAWGGRGRWAWLAAVPAAGMLALGVRDLAVSGDEGVLWWGGPLLAGALVLWDLALHDGVLRRGAPAVPAAP